MASSLKEQKEAFVTGHDGTAPWEILLVCLSAPLGVCLVTKLRFSTKWHPATEAASEALFLLLPMAICQTSLLYPWGVGILCFEAVCALSLSFSSLSASSSSSTTPTRTTTRPTNHSSFHFLSSYRSTVLYLTFVAILAVDFHVFPRRFAKTEVTGYGLMDLGAGSFVVAAGLVSKRAKGSVGKLQMDGKLQSWWWWWQRRILPLLLLGGIRLVTNSQDVLEYQLHVSEYGVQWNFFFTLAVVTILATLIPTTGILPVIQLLAPYQWALSRWGLQEYMEDGPRTCQDTQNVMCHFFAANREGILGCIGYLALYLASEHVGRLCLWTRSTSRQRGVCLWVASGLLWALHGFIVHVVHIPVSRRTTNMAFCVWTLAHNVTLLACLWATTYGPPPPVFDAVNRHGLLVFVVANLLTGLVNISMNTLDASDGQALLILFVYLCAVGAFSRIIDHLMSAKLITSKQK